MYQFRHSVYSDAVMSVMPLAIEILAHRQMFTGIHPSIMVPALDERGYQLSCEVWRIEADEILCLRERLG